MAAGTDPTKTDSSFKYVTKTIVEFSSGDDVTLPCQLSSEISPDDIEIRWFKQTECIYLYKDKNWLKLRGYEHRVIVNYEGIGGDVSLKLKGCTVKDEGEYICQVISGQHREETYIELVAKTTEQRKEMEKSVQALAKTTEQRKEMEKSVQALELQQEEPLGRNLQVLAEQEQRQDVTQSESEPHHSRRRDSMEEPLDMEGEGSGSASPGSSAS